MKKGYARILLIGLMTLVVMSLALVGCGNDDENEKDNNKGQDAQQDQITIEEFRAEVDVDKVIAELEETKITYGELIDQLEAEDIIQPGIAAYALSNKDAVLADYAKQLVIRKDIYNQGVALNVTANTQAIDEEINYIKTMSADLTEAQLEKIKGLFSYYDIITSTLNQKVTDESALEVYNQKPADFTTASVRHILVQFEGRTEEEAKTLADELTDRIRQGEDMADLATEHTDDPGSKDTGGLYENQPVMMWVDEFKQAALDFELNVVGDPVKTTYGYHVMRVEDRIVPAFDEIKDMIKESLAAEDFEAYVASIQDKVAVNL